MPTCGRSRAAGSVRWGAALSARGAAFLKGRSTARQEKEGDPLLAPREPPRGRWPRGGRRRGSWDPDEPCGGCGRGGESRRRGALRGQQACARGGARAVEALGDGRLGLGEAVVLLREQRVAGFVSFARVKGATKPWRFDAAPGAGRARAPRGASAARRARPPSQGLCEARASAAKTPVRLRMASGGRVREKLCEASRGGRRAGRAGGTSIRAPTANI